MYTNMDICVHGILFSPEDIFIDLREREKHQYEKNSNQLPPIRALTGDWTHNLLVYGQHSNHLSYTTRAKINFCEVLDFGKNLLYQLVYVIIVACSEICTEDFSLYLVLFPKSPWKARRYLHVCEAAQVILRTTVLEDRP